MTKPLTEEQIQAGVRAGREAIHATCQHLENEVTRLTEDRAALVEQAAYYKREAERLTAENERLRADNEAQEEDIKRHMRTIHARDRLVSIAESRLATAVAAAAKALTLLARAQDGSPKTPREANSHSVQLDYEIGQLLQSEGWVWDAINRRWTEAETGSATWTEYRGRQP